MNVELLSLSQQVSLSTAESTHFLHIRLPNGEVVSALISETVAEAIASAVAGAPAPASAPPPRPSAPRSALRRTPPVGYEEEEERDAQVVARPKVALQQDATGNLFSEFGGEEIPEGDKVEFRPAPTTAQRPRAFVPPMPPSPEEEPEPELEPQARVWSDPQAQAKAFQAAAKAQKKAGFAPMIQRVQKDDLGYPRPIVQGGVEVNQVIGGGGEQDENGIGSI